MNIYGIKSVGDILLFLAIYKVIFYANIIQMNTAGYLSKTMHKVMKVVPYEHKNRKKMGYHCGHSR